MSRKPAATKRPQTTNMNRNISKEVINRATNSHAELYPSRVLSSKKGSLTENAVLSDFGQNMKGKAETKIVVKKQASKTWGKVYNKRQMIDKMGIKAYGGNWHNNFVDLNPSWAKARHQRAVDRADEVVSDIGAALMGKYHKKHLKLFEKDIDKGKRLTLAELRGLKSDYKDVYTKVIKEHDEEINKYVDAAQDKANDQIDELAGA